MRGEMRRGAQARRVRARRVHGTAEAAVADTADSGGVRALLSPRTS